ATTRGVTRLGAFGDQPFPAPRADLLEIGLVGMPPVLGLADGVLPIEQLPQTAFALQEVMIALVLATDLQHVEDVVVHLDTGSPGLVGAGEVDARLEPGETRVRPLESDDLAVDDEILPGTAQRIGDLRKCRPAILALA